MFTRDSDDNGTLWPWPPQPLHFLWPRTTRADLQAGNGDRGTTGKDGPADRHLQASREPLAQVGQHGRRHWKGTPGDTL